MAQPLADDIVRFVQAHLGSVWALRLMLAMRAQPDERWTVERLRLELRATDRLIGQLLERFERLGLAIQEEGKAWLWHPAMAEIDELSRRVAEAYAVTPFGVIQAIAEAPDLSLRQFADAFKLQRDRE